MTIIDSEVMFPTNSHKILIADDQDINIEALKTILKIYGVDEYQSEVSKTDDKIFGFGNAIQISRSSDDFDIKQIDTV